MDGGSTSGGSKSRKRRSRILYEITALIVVVLVISGLVTFFLVRDSQNKLIDKSIDKVIETESKNIASALDYMIRMEMETGMTDLGLQRLDSMELIADMAQKKLTDFQRKIDSAFGRMVDTGFFNLEYIFVVVPPSSLVRDPIVMASSDESMVYDWEIPEYLLQAIEAGEPYILMKEGIPELDLEEQQLIILQPGESPVMKGFYFTFVNVIPMQERIDAINAFFDEERDSISLTLGLSVFISIIAVIIITFFVLNYLIRMRITAPIEQLAAEAEEVMQGDLDVDIVVHEGGEFQGLERAFKEMVESFRTYIAKSTGEE